jgi:hypothetical protein
MLKTLLVDITLVETMLAEATFLEMTIKASSNVLGTALGRMLGTMMGMLPKTRWVGSILVKTTLAERMLVDVMVKAISNMLGKTTSNTFGTTLRRMLGTLLGTWRRHLPRQCSSRCMTIKSSSFLKMTIKSSSTVFGLGPGHNAGHDAGHAA